MGYYLVKTIASAMLIVIISEVAKKSSLFGAIVASLPTTSILAMFWLYLETKDLKMVMDLSLDIFWIVLPSLMFFVAMYYLVKIGMGFYLAITFSMGIMSLSYFIYLKIIRGLGVNI